MTPADRRVAQGMVDLEEQSADLQDAIDLANRAMRLPASGSARFKPAGDRWSCRMKLCDGRRLRYLIEHAGPLPPTIAAGLLRRHAASWEVEGDPDFSTAVRAVL